MKQHKWHKEIKAWADGAEIESRYIGKTDLKQLKEWSDACDMDWDCSQTEFRIKPQPKEDWVMICKRCGDELGIVYGEDNV